MSDVQTPLAVRVLLYCYPRATRQRHGQDIAAFWYSQRSEARYAGRLGAARYWLAVVIDAVASGLRMRLRRRLGPHHTRSSREVTMSHFGVDIRSALRTLRGAPGFVAVSVLTLALGIGATTAIFAVVNGVLLRPLPFPGAEELVRVERAPTREGDDGAVAWPDFRDWREQAVGFSGLAAFAKSDASFQWDGEAETLDGSYVTRNFFEVMGVGLAMGRTFVDSEDVLGGADAIILSHALWQRRFQGDPTVLGRRIDVDGESLPVVGVAAAGFEYPIGAAMFWRPLQDDQLLATAGLPTGTRDLSFLEIVGRLDGVPLATAEEQLSRVAAAIDADAGRADKAGGVRLMGLADAIVGTSSQTLMFLLAAVALVLSVACANVAGLSLSRTAARHRELAVRGSLGAAPARLFAQLLTEHVMVAAVAGGLGAAIAVGVASVLRRMAPDGLPRVDDIRVDPTVMLFSVGLTLVVGTLCGILPAWQAARTNVMAGLMSQGRGSSGSRESLRPQQLLVVAQVTVAVVLLSAAALLGLSYYRLTSVERGFTADRVILASVQPSGQRYQTPAALDGFYVSLLDRVRALPGVRTASATYSPPMADNLFKTRVARAGEADLATSQHWTGTVVIRDDYFETLGIPLLAGRDFDSNDRLGHPLVAIVNQAMADLMWPGADPVGQQFEFAGGVSGAADTFDRAFFPNEKYTVVGVAGNVRRTRLDQTPEPEYYRPHAQITWGFQYLLIRTTADPGPVMQAVRQTVWSVDPTVPVRTLRTLESQVASSVATPRFRTMLVMVFAMLAALLAMVGLYAVMAMSVQRRMREMGIRIALGAQRPRVLATVLRQGLSLVVVGLLCGVAVAVLGRSAVSGMLFDVTPGDPLTYAGVVLLTSCVAAAACYLPARRASRVDPSESLREG